MWSKNVYCVYVSLTECRNKPEHSGSL